MLAKLDFDRRTVLAENIKYAADALQFSIDFSYITLFQKGVEQVAIGQNVTFLGGVKDHRASSGRDVSPKNVAWISVCARRAFDFHRAPNCRIDEVRWVNVAIGLKEIPKD